MAKQQKIKIRDCWNEEGVWSNALDKCAKLQEVTHCRNCEIFEQAARAAFEVNIPAGYRQQWTKKLQNPQDLAEEKSISGIVFRLQAEWYLLDASCFDKVASVKEIHSIPHNSNDYVTGLVNIDGSVRICFSLNKLLGISESEDGDSVVHAKVFKRFIVITIQKDEYIFQVDEVKGLERYAEKNVQPAPKSYVESMRGLAPTVIKSNYGMLNILNHNQINQMIKTSW
jgi:chemotaxis-related protein WspD